MAVSLPYIFPKVLLVGLQCVSVAFPGHKDLLFQAGATRLIRRCSLCNITSITKCSFVGKPTNKWFCMQQTDEKPAKFDDSIKQNGKVLLHQYTN